jgi:AraC-like DNA-binding protein
VGKCVRALGACIQSTLTPDVFGVPASELVDRVVPLQELWTPDDAERLFASLSGCEMRRGLSALRDELVARITRSSSAETVGQTAARLIQLHAGSVSIDDMARSHGLSRQQFAGRFCAGTGLPPKLFARITRFQALVHALLSTDVSRWASLSSAVGFHNQAHMINEFRGFAGSPPTVFFRPHGIDTDSARIHLRGRSSEWLCRPSRSLWMNPSSIRYKRRNIYNPRASRYRHISVAPYD